MRVIGLKNVTNELELLEEWSRSGILDFENTVIQGVSGLKGKNKTLDLKDDFKSIWQKPYPNLLSHGNLSGAFQKKTVFILYF